MFHELGPEEGDPAKAGRYLQGVGGASGQGGCVTGWWAENGEGQEGTQWVRIMWKVLIQAMVMGC